LRKFQKVDIVPRQTSRLTPTIINSRKFIVAIPVRNPDGKGFC